MLGYGIYRREGNGAWTQIARVNGENTVSYYDQTVKDQFLKTYTYSVKSRSRGYTSDINQAGSEIFRLQPPHITEGVNTKGGIVWLRWKTAPLAEGYRIQYTDDSGFRTFKTIEISGGKSSTCKISGLEKGKRYYFRTCCFRKVGNRTVTSGMEKSSMVGVYR